VLRVWRVLLYGASVMLVAAALIQLSGRGVSMAGESTGAAAFAALETCFLLQLLAVVGLQITASVRPASVGRSALFWCALLPLVESGAIALRTGLSFLALLLAAAGFTVAGAIVTRPNRQAAGAALG
jgi:hypothetical protein